MKKIYVACAVAALFAGTAGAANTPTNYQLELMSKLDASKAPAQNFEMRKWKINLPYPDTKPEREGKTMEVYASQLNDAENPFSHPEWFYTNAETGAMVFKVPNEAVTTPNSKNARSELRAMLNVNLPTGYKDPSTNFVLASHDNAAAYGSIGGRMSAALSVDHVSLSGNDAKMGAHSVVIGQIHGSNNEPLKIFFRKLPNHEHGSLFWNYEINPKDKKDRFDIPHNIFGQYNLTKDDKDPVGGIKLGELFSYDVDIVDNIMNLTFTKNPGEANEQVVTYRVNLAEPNSASDLDTSYAQDWMYFKAGAYNQCNIKPKTNTWSSGCSNNGLDAGDYTQVSFYKLNLIQ
ncbi:polysaccharide lyase family 7 protein [Agarivorans sp. JK6]|uniref:polysaccharide lyase family 7 protein n=1 Tax=Agarivorans sp. JK6 TaxID=2997426 RepID=UPI00387313C4